MTYGFKIIREPRIIKVHLYEAVSGPLFAGDCTHWLNPSASATTWAATALMPGVAGASSLHGLLVRDKLVRPCLAHGGPSVSSVERSGL